MWFTCNREGSCSKLLECSGSVTLLYRADDLCPGFFAALRLKSQEGHWLVGKAHFRKGWVEGEDAQGRETNVPKVLLQNLKTGSGCGSLCNFLFKMTTNRQNKINYNVYFPFTSWKMSSVFLLIFTPRKFIIHAEDFPRKWWFVSHVGNRTSETTFLDYWIKENSKNKTP